MPDFLYLISTKPLSVSESLLPFENFSKEDTAYLYRSLLENWIEVLNFNDGFNLYVLLDETETDAIASIQQLKTPVDTFNSKKLLPFLKNQLEKYDVHNFPKIIFVISDSIGISDRGIKKYFNILENEDNNLLLVKNKNEKICLIGFNFYNYKILENLFIAEFKADKFLSTYPQNDFFLFVIEGILQFNDKSDFRKLYEVLSSKGSIEFCSQEMHEKFTHLFIEYKELL